ncbi:MAG: HAD family phosphatase [Chitinophagaceae bacterium]|nr:HAD family phosphatase [Chitinophagaceae bacterium]
MMAQTKNIIFDLGGVLLNLDFQKTIDAFEKLGLQNFENMFSQFKADELFAKLETGRLTETEFYEAVKKRTTQEITEAAIDDAWNALILDFRVESLSLLEKLAADYKLYLLSNTNSIHLKYFKKLFTHQTGKPLLDDYFNKAWYSNEVGLRKPGAGIFEFALKDENLLAAETLFIDDTLINIETAQQLGFKTHHLLPTERIELLDIDSI